MADDSTARPSILDILPPELITSILTRLDRRSLATTSLVSTEFNSLSLPLLYSSVLVLGNSSSTAVTDSLEEHQFLENRIRISRQLIDALRQDEQKIAALKTLELKDYNWLGEEWESMSYIVKRAPLRALIMDMTSSHNVLDYDGHEFEDELQSFWSSLSSIKTLRSLKLIIGPSIPLALTDFAHLTHIHIKGYSIDLEDDHPLPPSLTHLALDYVHNFDREFFRPQVLENLRELVLRNDPADVWAVVAGVFKTFASLVPPVKSALTSLVLDPFPQGFACLTPHTFSHLTPLFTHLTSTCFTSLTSLSILSTPVTINFVQDALDFLHRISSSLPKLQDLVYFVGTGVQFVSPEVTNSTALVLRDNRLPPPPSRALPAESDEEDEVELGQTGLRNWVEVFAKFKNLKDLTHNLIEIPSIIVSRDVHFAELLSLKVLTFRACPRNGFRFERVLDEKKEVHFRPVRLGQLRWVDDQG